MINLETVQNYHKNMPYWQYIDLRIIYIYIYIKNLQWVSSTSDVHNYYICIGTKLALISCDVALRQTITRKICMLLEQ